MPLLFYLPFIIWTGLREVVQGETRALSKSLRYPRLDNDRTRYELELPQGTDGPVCRSPYGADLWKGNHLVCRLPTLTTPLG
jgi:hypothetical protein